jgi:hypothetical protein
LFNALAVKKHAGETANTFLPGGQAAATPLNFVLQFYLYNLWEIFHQTVLIYQITTVAGYSYYILSSIARRCSVSENISRFGL